MNFDDYINHPKRYVSGMATDPPYHNDNELTPELTEDSSAYWSGVDDNVEIEIMKSINNSDFEEEEEEIVNHIKGSYSNDMKQNINNQYEINLIEDSNGTIPTIASVNSIVARREYLDNLSSHESMPGLMSDSDWSTTDEESSSEEEQDFQGFDYDRIYVQTYNEQPANLNSNYSAGAFKDNKFYVSKIIDNSASNDDSIYDYEIEEIKTIENDDYIKTVFSNKKCKVVNLGNKNVNRVTRNVNRYYKTDEVEEIYNEQVEYVHDSNDQWFINVPIQYGNGNVIKTAIFADSGANAACVNYQWAFDNFADFICENTSKTLLKTPGGLVKPKYCLWMSFPTKTGKILKAKLYLVKDLSVIILADINMLRAFGYKFKDGTPPVFTHESKEDLDLEMKTQDELLSNRYENYNWFKSRHKSKRYQLHINLAAQINENDKLHIYDLLKSNDQILYENVKQINEMKEITMTNEIDEPHLRDIYNEKDKYFDANLVSDVDIKLKEVSNNNEILNIDNVETKELLTISNEIDNVNSIVQSINGESIHNIVNYNYSNMFNFKGLSIQDTTIYNGLDRHGNSLEQAPIYHSCMFIVSRESFQATREEIARAEAIRKNSNKDLTFKNLDYLKSYPSKYGMIYNNLYEEVMAWIERHKKIFATKTFSRKTMTVPYARLGIKPEHRDKTMFAAQYPINEKKRIDMINYTHFNEKNGFWKKIDYSLNCVPYTMVPKKKNGKIVRYRPAFDGRVVNQYCLLMNSNMPTLKDFRELHSIKGLVTMADIKNCFDCIPLHPDDRKYAVAHTPLGLYKMNCLTYGWMNAAPEAQKIMNQVALHIGDTLAYIDDICIKHRFDNGTKGVMEQLEKLAEICYKFNLQLNPSKFVPACDYTESFGFQNSMIGEMISKSYQEKLLALTKPTTKAEARSVDGMLNYINNHIYNNKVLMYWINSLVEELDIKTKKKRLKWTKQANLAWLQIKWLIANLPLLHHPTRNGKFCLQTDACNYGVGAVLWQLQYDNKIGMERWNIVDLWSKTIPQQLRHCHSMIHEAYAISTAIEHWQFYLIKRDFIVSTDNLPIANLYGKLWKYLNPITQKQLIRLRSKISNFSFSSYHVEGLENPIADGLSRYTMKLIELETKKPAQEQQIPLQLEAITSLDTKTPKLTPKQKQLMKQTIIESQRLQRQLEELKREPVKFINAMNTHTYEVTPTNTYSNIDNYNNIDINKMNESNFDSDNKAWNSFMTDYKLHSNYLQRNKIQQLTKYSKELINQNEDEMKDQDWDNLESHLVNMLLDVHNLQDNLKDDLRITIYDQLEQLQKEKKDLIKRNVNQVDEEYNILDDLEEDDPLLKKSNFEPRITRSKAKKMHQRQENFEEESKEGKEQEKEIQDTDDEMLDFEFTNIQFENERDVIKTRHEFIQQIFGHRDDMDILEFEKFKNIQRSDNLLALIYNLLQQDKNEWQQEDLDLIKNQDFKLYKLLMKGKIDISVGLLTVEMTDDRTNTLIDKLIIPFNIRGKLMDYAHHSLSSHHVSYRQMLYNLESYWWSSMKKDVRIFCKQCVLCQFVNGNITHRTPLVTRELKKPREHLFLDFVGPIYGIYYILVIVDKATGYVMLTPVKGCDALVVINTLINKWIPIFGWPKVFESDWGSGFNNNLIKTLLKLTNVKFEMAEPRNHRSIGKVERIIGYIQQILNQYNLLLENQLTDKIHEFDQAWKTIETIIPLIQLSLNQRRPRFTTFSPNILMFGSNMNDVTDIARMQLNLNKLYNNNNYDLKKNDYKYLSKLIENLKSIRTMFENDWKKYTWQSKEYYNRKFNINENSIKRYRKKFKIGSKVLYYIGDKKVARYKWKSKWTGPWIIDKIINDTSLIIKDIENGNQKRVNFDRIKLFNTRDYENIYSLQFDSKYLKYQKQLQENLSNYNVKFREQDHQLDYNMIH